MRQHERRKSFLELIEPDPGSSFHCLLRDSAHGYRFNWHHHPELELTWIMRGTGLRFAGDSIMEFGPGDLVLLGPNLPHTWTSHNSNESTRAMVVQFLPKLLDPLSSYPEMRSLQPLIHAAGLGVLPATPTARQATKKLASLLEVSPADPQRWMILLEALLILAQGHWQTLATPGYRTDASGPAGVRLRKVLAHLEANFDRPDSAADLARLVRMTPQGFSRFFHRQVGCTFVTYLNRWRISLACRKLLESDEPITKIAYQVGFNNLSNFHRRFRQFKDMTPAQYRRKVHSEPTNFSKADRS